MLLRVTYDAQEAFLCVTSYCGTLQYSALVNSVFTNTLKKKFGLTLTFVYKYTICMAWRFHFPPRKYDFNCFVGRATILSPAGSVTNVSFCPCLVCSFFLDLSLVGQKQDIVRQTTCISSYIHEVTTWLIVITVQTNLANKNATLGGKTSPWLFDYMKKLTSKRVKVS